tara:strand:+ start:4204 stop:5106 length:903 start_codon:yes stop_codon:yes gene_type:complete
MLNEIENFLDTSSQFLIGRRTEIHLSLVGILSRGHILIEDQPGMGKTILANLLAQLLDRPLNRIQFTNDLLPADILGGPVWIKDESAFLFEPGPIFGEMILADELNRASPKTQSALLQAMEERQVSIDNKNHGLPDQFCVLATQNPYEQVGTHPLPESQLDRFSLGITLELPSRDLEKKILVLEDPRDKIKELRACISKEFALELFNQAKQVVVSDQLLDYVLDLLQGLRKNGAHISPRAGQDLIVLAKMQAIFNQRNHVTPDDIQFLAPGVLGHRVGGSRGMKVGQFEVSRLVDELPIP